MKRITVSLPDELVDEIKRVSGERNVSAYVAAALEDYRERASLDEVLAAWRAETPIPDDVRQQARDELERVGFAGQDGRDDRLTG